MAALDMTTALRALILTTPPRLPPCMLTVEAVAGQRVFFGADLPAGYDPKAVLTNPTLTGPAILFSDRGGRPGRTSVLLESIYHAQCYATTQPIARDLDEVLFAALHDHARGCVRSVRCTTTGQHLVDTRTNWHLYVSVWQVLAVMG